MSTQQVTVAQYLKIRLEELGCEHIFGVAGNYSAPFLNTIEEDPESTIQISGNTNEINAGHCADGYARVSGKIAPVGVTYGVGAFSLLNPVAGSYVEHNRVLVLNGAPTYSEQKRQRVEGILYSHMTGDEKSNIDAYRSVTVAAEQIRNASQAPAKIDTVLTAIISEGRPGYIEVYEDVWRKSCDAPVSSLDAEPHQGDESETDKAVTATLDMIKQRGTPIFWAGIELQRQQLQSDFQSLVETTNNPFVTSILAKSVLPESHELFRGVYNGNATPESTKALFNNAGCRIALGVWNTSKNLGGTSSWSAGMVMANNEGVKVGHHIDSEGHEVGTQYFPNVVLKDFIAKLNAKIADMEYQRYQPTMTLLMAKVPQDCTQPLSYDSFFSVIDDYLTDEHRVVVDAGFPLLGAQNLRINQADGFVSAAAWLSIGYSVPASLGVKFADQSKRPLVFVGDGAFQETCQSVSGHNYYKTNNVVFVLDNGIYGIEQMLVNPNPFRTEDEKVHYESRPQQNDVYKYNRLNKWNYEKIVEMVGGRGAVVSTHDELRNALTEVDQYPEDNFVIRVMLSETNIPHSIAYRTQSLGEDEQPDSVPVVITEQTDSNN
ncbi:putative Thiamine pyrophosphate-requiring enzyme [Vibrio nigripulchritudo SO65]|uniref:alpha-keto acid decarboxylase family protein n=1 Tax=Vibrio nigripulchritudo TaxID=28173 RepID=UPI0003B233B9|nr:thiamine pyrophosphate-binding protein [Vibrio nigripulchritudo]CCN33899.1 putative Thiamine pyrophosphate-requiring enzyme [Vibrio nigripulchritudo AM115]CCN43781.1 putative Thiamine pyrophosphate-requiring enzyme [Vibrio nigripulchritudo FTn2]CCN65181.1 putative Thiamine pyrophosphate-requiring enzyme [Vibrio nigripulchritudo POn4]CCN78984.1 putative Thiamine pyrophosphate-requiring enzyme [Vibrio nigripulchritudo SO65]